ncbi:SET domain-containing protein-lysine N-methyltransferase [Aquisphaera insulae]|uniref:SET domain-containing protein-lysine N-methyltransferase n=1 Tax=Aquisphaera insulae TaxID=2712864 RepID=UPI0013EAFD4C|nr:SET domain-containing protein [Aquisphaera insulae]
MANETEWEQSTSGHATLVYARLQPSPIHGVGVFAIRRIPAGVYPFEPDPCDILWIPKSEVDRSEPRFAELYRDFCIPKGDMLGCPRNFNEMTLSWYVNFSRHPNLACDAEYRFYAIRDILAGEELTLDYTTYSDYRPDDA